jgi:RNA-directed DNA polymerase
VLSPLLANIALSALDEHVHGLWQPDKAMGSPAGRALRRRRGLPNWRIVRYADDFVVLVFGSRDDAETLREEIANVLAPLGLRFSEAKTRVVHMSEGLDFLGFRIQWKRKPGTDKWYVYVFIADRAIRSLKDKIRALTNRLSQQPPRDVLRRLNQIMRGWSSYFRYAVAKRTLQTLAIFVWRRIARWWMRLHRWNWTDLRQHLTGHDGRWRMPSADGVELFNLGRVPTARYRYRGNTIPDPWITANHA